MSTGADFIPRAFTLDPTDHPLWLRLEFQTPTHEVHRMIVEADWTDTIRRPGVSLYDLAATAIEVALSHQPDFRFPPTFSMGTLAGFFPNLKADVQARLNR